MTSEPPSIKERSQDNPNHEPQTLKKGAGETLQRPRSSAQWPQRPQRPGQTHLIPRIVRRALCFSRCQASRPTGLIVLSGTCLTKAVITALIGHMIEFLIPDPSSREKGEQSRNQQKRGRRSGQLRRLPEAGPGRPRGFVAPRNGAAGDVSQAEHGSQQLFSAKQQGRAGGAWLSTPPPPPRCVRPHPSIRPRSPPGTGSDAATAPPHFQSGFPRCQWRGRGGRASLENATCFATFPCCARMGSQEGPPHTHALPVLLS